MIGVVHATRPIDAIQRIASRVDLGTIPSIVDTTIYIEDGEISAIYENKLTVKVPSGMEERDLARPVIEVRDFESGTLVNEIYTYGEQTIVMDIGMVEQSKKANKKDKTPVQLIAEREILKTMKRIAPKASIEVSMENDRRVNIYITEKYIPKIIGKGGKRITELENEIGISMNVEPLEKAPDSFAERLTKRSKKSKKDKKDKHKKSKKSQLKEYNDNMDDYIIDEGKKDYSKDNYFDLSEEEEDYEEGETSEFYYEVFELYPEIRKDHLVLPIGKKFVGSSFDILLEDKYMFTATVGKRGYVKLHKNLDLTDEIIDGLDKGLRVVARVRD